MICPACQKSLSQVEAGGVTVDVCRDGCGGIWFDNFELKKFDEPHESAGESLLAVGRDPNVVIDAERPRPCPKCKGVVMRRHKFSVKRAVEVDDCPNCGGIWLDAGELASIRGLFQSEEERKRAAEDYFRDVFESHPMNELKKQKAELQKARRMVGAFKYICPTYYIPGEQKWGGF